MKKEQETAEPKFEEVLKKLEAIVDELEGGGLNLDEAIKKYEEGMRLSNLCYKKLHEIQAKVEMLVKEQSGKLSAKDFSESKTADNATSGIKKRRPKGEELLF